MMNKKLLRSELKEGARYLSMGDSACSLGLVLGSKDEELIAFYESYDNNKLSGYAYESDFTNAS